MSIYYRTFLKLILSFLLKVYIQARGQGPNAVQNNIPHLATAWRVAQSCEQRLLWRGATRSSQRREYRTRGFRQNFWNQKPVENRTDTAPQTACGPRIIAASTQHQQPWRHRFQCRNNRPMRHVGQSKPRQRVF